MTFAMYLIVALADLIILVKGQMNQNFEFFFLANLLIKNQINIFRNFKVIGLCKTEKFQVEKCLF